MIIDGGMSGRLIVFEGLDQSGKQTQAERLRDRFRANEHRARLLSFPDYGTSIGEEIARALQGEREYGADVMQLLYVANRYERKDEMVAWLQGDITLICDRYVSSSLAYGEAQGLDPIWLIEIQKFLPKPDLTVLLDINPETAVKRKSTERDKYERDLTLLSHVRESYKRQVTDSWIEINGERPVDEVTEDIYAAVSLRFGQQ